MILNIYDVPKLAKNVMGRYRFREDAYSTIEISKRYNSKLHVWGVTLFHELIHFWVAMMRLRGAKLNTRAVHKLTAVVEDAFYQNLGLLK